MRIAALLCGIGAIGTLQAQYSPFTNKPLISPDSAGHYRLLIGGHFHGSSSNASGYPAATLLASLAAINAINANALLSTGDLFMDPDRDSVRFARSLFDRLDVALFNAPGNHDLEGKAYAQGARMPQLLKMGSDRILLLDTERDDSKLKDDQLDVLAGLADSASTSHMERLFIITHRPIWSEDDPRFAPLFAGNTRSLTGSNFGSDVLPLLERIATRTEVFWISGSMAGRAPASIFFQPDAQNITYIQCAIRDELRDAMLIADVSSLGVEWSGLSLTGMPMEEVTTYDAAWWKAHQTSEPAFNWRLIPYLVKKNLGYPSFWYGTGIGAALILAISLVVRSIQRPKE